MLYVKPTVLVHQSIEEVFRLVATDFIADPRSDIPFHIAQDKPYHTFAWEQNPDNSPGLHASMCGFATRLIQSYVEHR